MSDRGIPTVSGLSDVDLDLDRMQRQLATGSIAAVDLVALVVAASSRIAELEAVASDFTTENLRLDRDRAHAEAERDRLRDGIRLIADHAERDEPPERTAEFARSLLALLDGQEDTDG